MTTVRALEEKHLASTVERHLKDVGVEYDVIPHDHTANSMSTARSAHVSSEMMAKGIVLKDADGYLMAVMPATYKFSQNEMYDVLGRRLKLVDENELAEIFPDCDLGAVPPLGDAYGLEAVWDDSLSYRGEIYFEGGDHNNVVHVSGKDFRKLMGRAKHAYFSHHV